MIISFLVLWSICLSSSLVHFRKGPEYLTRGTAQVSIPLVRFLLESFVSSSYLVLLRYSLLLLLLLLYFEIFSHQHQVLIILFAFLQFRSVVFRIRQVLWFLLTLIWSGCLAEIKLIRLHHKMPENFVRLVFPNGFCVVHISFIHMINIKSFAQSLEDHLPQPIMSSDILCLIHSLTMWLIVSSLSRYKLCLQFCCVLSIFVLI